MTKDEMKEALLLSKDRLLDALTDTPWTVLVWALWTGACVGLGFAISAMVR